MSIPRPREDARRGHERPHVLIVTDDPSLASFLSEGLLMGGFWTSVISHGLQVLEVFRLRRFDLIVMDHDLGSFDAVELVARLRGRSSSPDPYAERTTAPVVMVASNETMVTPEVQDSLGIKEILIAPLELEDVVESLHHHFEIWRNENPDTPLADGT